MSEEITQAEQAAVTDRLSKNYGRTLEYFHSLHKDRTRAEMREWAERMREPNEESLQQIADTPLWRLTWENLETLQRHAPERRQETWEQIRAASREHVTSGAYAEDVLYCDSSPWGMAVFLSLREGLAENWKPSGGIEWTLIDQLAQAHSLWQHWLSILSQRSGAEWKRLTEKQAIYDAPRLDDAQAMDQAAAMADRFHRVFLRTLRAMRDLRRYPVTIQHAEQVNVGQQQVNLSNSEVTP